MTSKCGKNKKVAHEAIGERVTDVTAQLMVNRAQSQTTCETCEIGSLYTTNQFNEQL